MSAPYRCTTIASFMLVSRRMDPAAEAGRAGPRLPGPLISRGWGGAAASAGGSVGGVDDFRRRRVNRSGRSSRSDRRRFGRRAVCSSPSSGPPSSSSPSSMSAPSSARCLERPRQRRSGDRADRQRLRRDIRRGLRRGAAVGAGDALSPGHRLCRCCGSRDVARLSRISSASAGAGAEALARRRSSRRGARPRLMQRAFDAAHAAFVEVHLRRQRLDPQRELCISRLARDTSVTSRCRIS